MIVDDRLDTVLETPVAGRQGAATQWCQIVDILGRLSEPGAIEATPARQRALAHLHGLHARLGDGPAARALATVRLRSAALAAHLAALGPRTALAAIGAARLDAAQWLDLIPRLPIHARGALRHRRDLGVAVEALLDRLGIEDFVLPGPDPEAAHLPADAPAAASIIPLRVEPVRRTEAPPVAGGIGAIVRRIAEFRRGRDGEGAQVRLPLGDEAAHDAVALAIDIAIDAGGTIIAASGAEPGMLVGHRPFVAADPACAAHADAATLDAARAQRPIIGGQITLDGAPHIAGSWRIDAVPRFAEAGGRFTGYAAHLSRRSAAPPVDAQAAQRAGAEALHQLLHELRTPINAIQGFAELIQQQMLGPTPHQYRSIAASIAADAARMLAAFEDVERLVGLESGRIVPQAGEVCAAEVLERLIAQVAPLAAPREIRLRFGAPGHAMVVAMAEPELERTIWRLLSTLIGAAAPGERLAVMIEEARAPLDHARISLTLPDSLARDTGEAALGGDIARLGSGAQAMLGPGFALRLCEAELVAAGGALRRSGGEGRAMLAVSLPLAMPLALDRGTLAS